ncbi:hypothetical protein B0H10DRAFT_2219401 [Mycena sp. CBHHK59/15]|nr:hypothetical protein B0H10DRAFT_2219401 [Mycena sp. CBHHK59/15]
MLYQLLNRASHVPSEESARPGIRQDVLNLEKRCTDKAHALVQSIEVIFKRIAAEVAKAVSVAEARSTSVFENIALTLRWNQYLALMRRDGEYGPNDLNKDLTAPILPSVQTQWHMGINVEIPTLLSVFFQEIKTDLDGTIHALGDDSSTNIDVVRKSLGVESFVKELSRAVQQSITVRQRTADQVRMELLGAMKRMLREIHLLFIGFESTLLSDELEGLAVVEAILRNKEDHIFGVMDALKSRRQEIDLQLSP